MGDSRDNRAIPTAQAEIMTCNAAATYPKSPASRGERRLLVCFVVRGRTV